MASRGELSLEVVKALVAINRRTKPRYDECVMSTEERGTPPEENVYGIVVEEDE